MFNNVRRISRQLLAYGTADVLVLAVNLLLLPIYTRVLAPREYGALALLLVAEAVLKILNRWGLDAGFLRLHYECRTDDERRTLAKTIFVFLAAANAVVAVPLIVAARPATAWMFGSPEFAVVFQLLVVNGYVSTFLFLPLTMLRIQERAGEFAALSFARSAGTIGLRLIFVIVLRWGLFGIMLADLVVTLAVAGWLRHALSAMLGAQFSRALLVSVLRYGFPQVPNGLLTQAMGMGDRVVLGMFMPLRDVGLYLIGATIASVIKYYPVAFEAVWTPFAYDSLPRRDAPALFARMGTYAFTVLTFLTVALMGLAAPLMALTLPAAYMAVAPIVPMLTLAMAVQSIRGVPQTSLNIAKRTHIYPIVTAIGAAVGLAGNIVLVPKLGLQGSAVALLSSQTLATALTVFFAQRAYHIPYELPRLLKVVVAGALTYAALRMTPPASSWATLGLRSALLALFPLGLLALRFLRPHEWQDVRRLLVTLRRPAVPV